MAERAVPLSARARNLVRAVHRDVGYLLVGLTFVYALSGLAVNHLSQWDPNFQSYQRTIALQGPLPTEDEALANAVRAQLQITARPREIYRASPEQLDVVFDRRTLHIEPRAMRVIDEGQQQRFFLRLANWLHLNRGKKAWTYIADGYAILLLFLASSGLFMVPGRKGFLGRGAVFVFVGAMIPIAYVTLSGGPSGGR